RAYFSGPIRSAGTTASCLVLFLIDYLREMFGYAKYDPTEEEVKRYVTENYDYHERVTNLQYLPTEEEIEFLAKNMPIEIAGEPTEKREVSNYKNLARVDTNFIRGGMCLCFSEGLAQKAAKGYRLLKASKEKGIKSTGWDFLPDYIKLHEKREKGKTDSSPTYIQDLVAGRPVFGHPSRSGGFRVRYGRSRVSGFSANAIHPATMAITDDFIATGTQLKIEKPTKGCIVTACDCIDGPIVKLINGSVRKLNTREEAKKMYKDVEEIIYLGDMLIPYSDVVNRNFRLLKPGYVEEWWNLELKEKAGCVSKSIDYLNISFEEAIGFSEKYQIPLHPKFIFYWSQINKEQFLELINWLKYSRVSKKIIFPYSKSEQDKFKIGKRALELLGIEHEVTIENVVLSEENSNALFINLGLDLDLLEKEDILLNDYIFSDRFSLETDSVLEIVNVVSGFEIKDKAGEFIGSRMGRPEKAKLRKLVGSPNVLFPVGREGGRLRSIQAACEEGKVNSSFPIYYCDKCKKDMIYPSCEECGGRCKKMFYCRECMSKSDKKCREHEKGDVFANESLDINYYINKAKERLGLNKDEMPLLIKGVRGTSSAGHATEHLAKGILRALHDLKVNKDGTIRYDATEAPIVCFKPKEIFVGVEKLKELGYMKDIYGRDLVDENQILEL
ncbi:MAG: DNA polymerase II large subunit, partial [Candidatus Nanoarchaeia archaeon]